MEDLWVRAIDAISTYGPFAVVCAILIVYIFKKNDERERRYIGVIEQLTTSVGDLSDIKNTILNIDRKVDNIIIKGGA